MSRNWVAVASAEHVRIGRGQGFMQVCHGKAAPLKRIQPGDRVVYYSPTSVFRGQDKLQSFTAIGVVDDGLPYQANMGSGFSPFRRNVNWCAAREAPIKPLVGRLQLTTAKRNWGFQLRFGLFEISEHDMAMIAAAMGLSIADIVGHVLPEPLPIGPSAKADVTWRPLPVPKPIATVFWNRDPARCRQKLRYWL